MLTLLGWLLKAQYALTALIALNVVLAAHHRLSGATGKGGEVGIVLLLLAVTGGCAAGAQRAALALLLGFWLLVLISVIVAASQARWNSHVHSSPAGDRSP